MDGDGEKARIGDAHRAKLEPKKKESGQFGGVAEEADMVLINESLNQSCEIPIFTLHMRVLPNFGYSWIGLWVIR